jgi:DNA primase
MATWIDFKALKQTLRFETVLRHYGVEVKAKGNQHHGFCPLPNHNGKRNSPSFSANLEKGIFQCFGCGAHGNVLDFAILMSGGSPDDADDIRKTALHLQKTFGVPQVEQSKAPKQERTEAKADVVPALVNVPLDFELKTLDFNHPYLRTRGFTDATIKDFGLGYCAKGYLAGRIAIPLYDRQGRLVGYAGRIVDDSLISEENPRYKFPGERTRKGVKHQFHKTEFLYAGYRVTPPVDDLIVVEGFPSVWWLTQYSIPSVVGLMGCCCSEKQAKLMVSLVKPSGRVWLMPDGDESGERCAESVLLQVALHRFARWVKLEAGKQPTDYPGEELNRMLGKGGAA